MRLKNKKTGEIAEFEDITRVFKFIGNQNTYSSLAEFIDDWEDYEEPERKHWYMTSWGEVWQYGDDPLHEEWRIILGNDFETKEEAEKAVEKLKAWKRLKDNGFEFDGIRLEGSNCLIKTKLKDNTGVTFDHAQQFYEDVDLLFGGEE